MSSAYQFFHQGHKLASLTELEGLLIPDPDAMQGWVVFVVSVPGYPLGAYYSLSLTSGAALSPADVRPTLLGGASRWLRLEFESTVLGGPPTPILPDDPGDEGESTSAARSDHQHAIEADVPVPLGPELLEGVSEAFARADHVHTNPTPALLKFSGAIQPLNFEPPFTIQFADGGGEDSVWSLGLAGPYPSYPVAKPQRFTSLAINVQTGDADFALDQGDTLEFQLMKNGAPVGAPISYDAFVTGSNVKTAAFAAVEFTPFDKLGLRAVFNGDAIPAGWQTPLYVSTTVG